MHSHETGNVNITFYHHHYEHWGIVNADKSSEANENWDSYTDQYLNHETDILIKQKYTERTMHLD